MRNVLNNNLISAAMAGIMCCLVAVGYVGASLGVAHAAQAPAALTAAQVISIQSQINAAIDAVNQKQFDPAAADPAAAALCNCSQATQVNTVNNVATRQCDNPNKLAAYAQAIADLTVSLVQTYGAQSAGEIGSIILASATAKGVPTSAIGVGLGRGAQQIAQTNGASAILIAQDIANEGTADIANCFASAAGQQLASVALGPPTVTGAGGNGGGPGNPAPGVVPVTATSSS